MIKRIISGGQTGADRAALDFAIDKDILHGGWVPIGRLAEDGPIPDKYQTRLSGVQLLHRPGLQVRRSLR